MMKDWFSPAERAKLQATACQQAVTPQSPYKLTRDDRAFLILLGISPD